VNAGWIEFSPGPAPREIRFTRRSGGLIRGVNPRNRPAGQPVIEPQQLAAIPLTATAGEKFSRRPRLTEGGCELGLI
jgi:hypothetical protein